MADMFGNLNRLLEDTGRSIGKVMPNTTIAVDEAGGKLFNDYLDRGLFAGGRVFNEANQFANATQEIDQVIEDSLPPEKMVEFGKMRQHAETLPPVQKQQALVAIKQQIHSLADPRLLEEREAVIDRSLGEFARGSTFGAVSEILGMEVGGESPEKQRFGDVLFPDDPIASTTLNVVAGVVSPSALMGVVKAAGKVPDVLRGIEKGLDAFDAKFPKLASEVGGVRVGSKVKAGDVPPTAEGLFERLAQATKRFHEDELGGISIGKGTGKPTGESALGDLLSIKQQKAGVAPPRFGPSGESALSELLTQAPPKGRTGLGQGSPAVRLVSEKTQAALFGKAKAKGISSSDLKSSFEIEKGRPMKFVGRSADDLMTQGEADILSTKLDKIDPGVPLEQKLRYLSEDIPPPKRPNESALMQNEDDFMPSSGEMGPITALMNKALRSGEAVWRSFGKLGNELADRGVSVTRMKAQLDAEDVRFIDDNIRGVVSDKESAEIARYLDGRIPINQLKSDKAKEVANIVSNKLDEKYGVATDAGIEAGYIGRFLPRSIDRDKIDLNPGDLAEHLMRESGGQLTRDDALKEVARIRRNSGGRKAAHLEKNRVADLPEDWYNQHWVLRKGRRVKETIPLDQVLERYFRQVNRRMAEVKHFGKEDETVKGLLEGINKVNGPDAHDTSKAIFDRFVGEDFALTKNERTHQAWAQTLRNFQIITKLGLAQIPNMTQTFVTVLPELVRSKGFVRGTKSFIEAFGEALTEGGRDFARRAGAISNELEKELLQITGDSISGNIASKFLTGVQFSRIERFNNTLAAVAGKFHTMDLINDARRTGTPDELKRIAQVAGFDDLKVSQMISQGASVEDLQDMGWAMARMTQFRNTALDIPLWWSSPMGKVFTQFKTFPFNMMRFMERGLKGLPAGDPKALRFASTLVGMGFISGEFVRGIRQSAPGYAFGDEEDKQTWNKRFIEDLSIMGTFGLWSDLLSAIQWQNAAGFFLGPSASDATRFLERTGQQLDSEEPYLGAGDAATAFGKEVLRTVPVAGRRVVKEINRKPKRSRRRLSSF